MCHFQIVVIRPGITVKSFFGKTWSQIHWYEISNGQLFEFWVETFYHNCERRYYVEIQNNLSVKFHLDPGLVSTSSLQSFPNSVKMCVCVCVCWGEANFAEVIFYRMKEWFWQFKPFSKLKTSFYEWWTSIKIKNSMTCVYKAHEIEKKMDRRKMKIFMGYNMRGSLLEDFPGGRGNEQISGWWGRLPHLFSREIPVTEWY